MAVDRNMSVEFRKTVLKMSADSMIRSVFIVIGCWLSSHNCFGQLLALPSRPWPNPRTITVSFAPDLVEIGRFRNELFMHMNDHLSFPDWQIEMLRACQLWSRHCGVQFALVPDSARAFGVPGLSQADPRFGDIRIGAFPQTNVLGNVIAFHPGHGSWSGDLFLDTNRQFYFHNWSSGSLPNHQFDLFTVALHELGNALGLIDDELNSQSVMFSSYTGPRNALHSQDINQIQSLYGPPLADLYEPTGGNETVRTATNLVYPPDFDQTLVLTTQGRIQGPGDVDVYRLQFTSLAENCWLKLRAKRRSLLCGRLTVYDNEFSELATDAAQDPRHNTVIAEITNRDPGEIVYIVIESADLPDFDFGDYELVLDFNPDGDIEEDDGDDDDDEEERFFEAGDRDLVNQLFDEFGLVDTETNSNNTFENAVELYSAPGLPPGSRFEIISTIASSDDIDCYRIDTPKTLRGSLIIELSPLSLDPTLLDVRVFDASQNLMKTRFRQRPGGDFVVEVPRSRSGPTYYVQVSNRTGNQYTSNYLLLIHTTSGASRLQPIQQFQLNSADSDRFGTMTNHKTQLFRIDTSMSSGGTGQAAQVTIYSDSGRVELATSIRPGSNSSDFVWLHSGQHYMRVTARTQDGEGISPSTVTIDGGPVSDDNGPILLDPSGNPISNPQSQGNDPTPPITWVFPVTHVWLYELVLPLINPWL